MKFKDTKYGDLTGKTYYEDIKIMKLNIKTLKGSPKIATGSFNCNNNEITSLKNSPKRVDGWFDMEDDNVRKFVKKYDVLNVSM